MSFPGLACSRATEENFERLREILHHNDVTDLTARAEALMTAADRAQQAAFGRECDRVAPQFSHHIIGHAARGIATGTGAAAICIPEIQCKISISRIADLS